MASKQLEQEPKEQKMGFITHTKNTHNHAVETSFPKVSFYTRYLCTFDFNVHTEFSCQAGVTFIPTGQWAPKYQVETFWDIIPHVQVWALKCSRKKLFFSFLVFLGIFQRCWAVETIFSRSPIIVCAYSLPMVFRSMQKKSSPFSERIHF